MIPLISVIINTYNHERFIGDAVRSVLTQDFYRERFEVIVVDDGSTDRTPQIVRAFEPEVRLLRKENGDQCSAIPYGVAHASGDLVAMLDGDDVWLPNKLSRVAQEFAKNPRVVMIYHNYIYWDSRDNSIWRPEYFTEVSGEVLADRSKLLSYCGAPTSSLVFRRNTFQPLTRIPSNRVFTYDTYLVTCALFLGPVACVPEVLTKNRVHGDNRWVAGQAGPDEATLRRRIARWGAMIEVVGGWTRANAPKSLRPQARLLLRRWRLVQDFQEFPLEPPNRVRRFQHACRLVLLEDPTSRGHVAYRFVHAFAGLIIGRHARYLEGVRTRVNRVRQRLQRRAGPEQTGRSTGDVP